jgi:hypothetical protein
MQKGDYWVDWKAIAVKHAQKGLKKGKPMAEVKNAVLKAEQPAQALQWFGDKWGANVVNNAPIQKVYNKYMLKAGDWVVAGDLAPVPKPPQPHFLDIPNPDKFMENVVPAKVVPEPDPFNDNLGNVMKELKQLIDYAADNNEEVPLTLVRAYNRLKQLEGNDSWVNGYNVGFADGGGNNKPEPQPAEFWDEPEPDDPEL